MQIYNTMTKKKETLCPIKPGEIGMYVCGPTVYSFIHIGNARPLIVFDTLRRYLEYTGVKVRYIQNFTDIDDKVIRRANDESCTYLDVSNKYIEEYFRDADALNVMRSTVNPRATEHIDEIISLVEKLIEKGHAYPADNGDVYFSVRSYPAYGKLKGQSIDDMESGARIDPTEHKKDPLDFALWKGAKPGEPSWDSPWGKGRPGWHIECSAMSMNILGETFDIHAGGVDLVFPHHENEIAQSEAATGKPFANYWMHNGHINVNNQKMSKSLGNFFTVRDITKEYEPEVLRLFMLGAHYRSPFNFSRELMDQAKSSLARLRTARERLMNAHVGAETEADAEFMKETEKTEAAFRAAMDDDLNTADALGVIFDFVRKCNTFVTEPRSEKALSEAKRLFADMTGVFGILIQEEAKEEFPAEALELLAQRTEARKVKDWAKSDELRDKLKEMGYAVVDSKDGAKLKVIE
ncbi:MAG: cysteine--tRNA ligase [Clostridia bacterium]|nr:cysteine--tRNA ligase [Clostridia bacterium]